MKVCTCEDYTQNMSKIDLIFDISYIHGYEYKGKFFEHCPWCGKEFVDQHHWELVWLTDDLEGFRCKVCGTEAVEPEDTRNLEKCLEMRKNEN